MEYILDNICEISDQTPHRFMSETGRIQMNPGLSLQLGAEYIFVKIGSNSAPLAIRLLL